MRGPHVAPAAILLTHVFPRSDHILSATYKDKCVIRLSDPSAFLKESEKKKCSAWGISLFLSPVWSSSSSQVSYTSFISQSFVLCEGLFIHVDVHDAKQWSIQYQSAAVIGSFSLFLFCGIIDVQAGSIFRSCFWDHRWDRSGAPLAAFHGPDGEPVLWGDTDPPIMGPHCSPLQKVRTHLWFLTDEIMLLFTWTYDSLSLNRKQTNIYNVRIYSPKNIQFSLIFSVLHTDIYTWMYLYLEDQRVSKYVFRWKNI